MYPQPARHPGKERPKCKGQNPRARHPYAKAGGGQFVFPDRQHRAAQRRVFQRPGNEDRQRHKQKDPPQRGQRRQPAKAQRPTRQPREVHRKALYDEDQAQRRYRKIVPAQPQHREPHNHGNGGGHQPPCHQRGQERPVLRHQKLGQLLQHHGLTLGRHDQKGGHIAAQCHERRMAQRKQPDEPVGDVQADGENDVDARKTDDRQRVGVQRPGGPPDQRGTNRRNRRRKNGPPATHARVSVDLPSRPFGITSKTTINAPNTKALRKPEYSGGSRPTNNTSDKPST